MNKLLGKIAQIESTGNVCLVDIDVDGDVFRSVILDGPTEVSYPKIGRRVELIFKETEVAVAKGLSGMISLSNRFPSVIKRIEKSQILTKVILNYKGKEIVSIISTRSAERLNLKEGEQVEWLVKANEISLFRES